MDLKDIQDKLNAMFAGTGRKLVFWYDDDASYEESGDGSRRKCRQDGQGFRESDLDDTACKVK